MTITLELSPDVEAKLVAQAQRDGLPVEDYVRIAVENLVKPKEFDLDSFLLLPREEQDRIIKASAEDAAPFYHADLLLPASERELTALTALDGEPFHDDAS